MDQQNAIHPCLNLESSVDCYFFIFAVLQIVAITRYYPIAPCQKETLAHSKPPATEDSKLKVIDNSLHNGE